MFYYSTKSSKKILHVGNCHHIKAIKEENLAAISNAAQARNEGFRICKCCSPISKDYKENEKEICKYAYENGLRCYMSKGSMYVQTVHDKWLILASGENNYALHHKNKYDGENSDSVPGYHNQHFWGIGIMEMMKYISEHEWYRMIHPLHIKHEKAPPRKGTKRWISQQRTQKKKERKKQIRNVLDLIDSLAI